MNILDDKALEIRSQIMAMMLNGTINWECGNFLRSLPDEELIEKFNEDNTNIS